MGAGNPFSKEFWVGEDDYGIREKTLTAAGSYIGAPGTTMGVDKDAAKLGDRNRSLREWGAYKADRRHLAPMQGATVGPMGTYGQNLWENMQKKFAGHMQGRASGEGPSAAEEQMKMLTDRARSAQLSSAAQGPGATRALQARNAATNMASVTGDIAGQTGALRAQEQAAAEAALGGIINQGRGAGIDLTRIGAERDISQAGFDQRTSEQNLQAKIKNKALNDALVKHYQDLGLREDQAVQQANMQSQNLMAQNFAASLGLPPGSEGALMPLIQSAGTGLVKWGLG